MSLFVCDGFYDFLCVSVDLLLIFCDCLMFFKWFSVICCMLLMFFVILFDLFCLFFACFCFRLDMSKRAGRPTKRGGR